MSCRSVATVASARTKLKEKGEARKDKASNKKVLTNVDESGFKTLMVMRMINSFYFLRLYNLIDLSSCRSNRNRESESMMKDGEKDVVRCSNQTELERRPVRLVSLSSCSNYSFLLNYSCFPIYIYSHLLQSLILQTVLKCQRSTITTRPTSNDIRNTNNLGTLARVIPQEWGNL